MMLLKIFLFVLFSGNPVLNFMFAIFLVLFLAWLSHYFISKTTIQQDLKNGIYIFIGILLVIFLMLLLGIM